jgi:hypothetical protein
LIATARPALPSLAYLLYALALALFLGLGSAYWAVRGSYPLGRTTTQGWIAYPKLGARDIDPYARAIIARTSEIPLGLGEGIALVAEADADGRALDAACSYRIAGLTPAARYWTLTLYGPDGRPVRNAIERSGFTSSEVLRDSEGRFEIALSRAPAAGNWLQTPETGRLRAILRLYDTPVAGSLSWLDPGSLPAVRREGCA